MTDRRGWVLALALLVVPAAARAQATAHAAPAPAPVPAEPGPPVELAPPDESSTSDNPLAELRDRGLELPVAGILPADLRDTFAARRGGGRTHGALDILAPRGTPVLAVEDGTVRRLRLANGGGGVVVYQADPSDRYVYYYAHLDRWAEGLAEGDPVVRGQVIGYVGTTGNAPPGTPHLHFAIHRVAPGSGAWRGTPLNPFDIWR